MTLTRRRIDLTFKLGTGDFGEGGSDTLELKDLRCSANIDIPGGSLGSLDLRVMGMTLDHMNKLTLLNTLSYTNGRYNTVTVAAGDDKSTAICFQGGISEAWADLKGQPEATFHVSAYAGLIDTLKPVAPTSFKGSVDVATAVQSIASKMQPPRVFEKNGVSIQFDNSYWPGTYAAQLAAIAQASRITIVDDGTTLAIYPEGGFRQSQEPVDVSPETGLVGYPAFSQNSISLTTIYNPAIKFGGKVKVKSALKTATGEFVVSGVTHNLDAETPNGPWFTRLNLVLPGQESPIPK